MKNLNLKTKGENMKGITLVSLVITIIVLLILATVSINLIINNGILDKTKYALDKYSEEEIKEHIRLAYLELETEKLYNTKVNEEEFLTLKLEDTFGKGNVNVKKINKQFKITINNKVYYISKDGSIEIANIYSKISPEVESLLDMRYFN